MRKILSLRGDALAKVMGKQSAIRERTRDAYGSDKKDCFPAPKQPMRYAAVSDFRSKTGIPFRKQPIGARQPQWSYGPDSATAREERVAMLSDGPIGDTWKANASSSRGKLDRAKHAKTLAQSSRVDAAKAEVRRALSGKADAIIADDIVSRRKACRDRAAKKAKRRPLLDAAQSEQPYNWHEGRKCEGKDWHVEKVTKKD